MEPSWPETFRARMRGFEMCRPPQPGEVSVSIKIRVVGSCFHRSCSPHAYDLIDAHLRRMSEREPEFAFEEHESGPEILVYVAAGLTLATSIINLVTTIIRARSEGVKKGDRPSTPIDLVVRRTVGSNSIQDEVVLKFGHTDPISAKVIEEHLNDALDRLLRANTKGPAPEPRANQRKPRRKRP